MACSGTAPFTAYFWSEPGGGVPPYTYSWRFGTGATSDEQNPSYTYTEAGLYAVYVTITDLCGNSQEKFFIVSVEGNEPGCNGHTTAPLSPSCVGLTPLTIGTTYDAELADGVLTNLFAYDVDPTKTYKLVATATGPVTFSCTSYTGPDCTGTTSSFAVTPNGCQEFDMPGLGSAEWLVFNAYTFPEGTGCLTFTLTEGDCSDGSTCAKAISVASGVTYTSPPILAGGFIWIKFNVVPGSGFFDYTTCNLDGGSFSGTGWIACNMTGVVIAPVSICSPQTSATSFAPATVYVKMDCFTSGRFTFTWNQM